METARSVVFGMQTTDMESGVNGALIGAGNTTAIFSLYSRLFVPIVDS